MSCPAATSLDPNQQENKLKPILVPRLAFLVAVKPQMRFALKSRRSSSSLLLLAALGFCLLLPLLLAQYDPFYSASSPIKLMVGTEFQSYVKDSDDVWIIQFLCFSYYLCKGDVGEYEDIAREYNATARFGAVFDESVIKAEGAESCPTVRKYLGKGKGVVDLKDLKCPYEAIQSGQCIGTDCISMKCTHPKALGFLVNPPAGSNAGALLFNCLMIVGVTLLQ